MTKKELKKRTKKRVYKPGILVCYEKHGNSFHWALTAQQAADASLEILRERYDSGWYYRPEEDKTEPQMVLEDIKKLPEGSIRAAAMREFNSWKSSRRWNEDLRVQYDWIEATLENDDGKSAYSILLDRSEGEYERIEKIHPQGEFKPVEAKV